jgi:biofilm protein TabA
MILDALGQADRYETLHRRFTAAFEFLRRPDLTSLSDGRHPLDGDQLVAIISRAQTKTLDVAVWESHRRYIDVQYIVAGAERVGFEPLSENCVVRTPYQAERDVVFYEPGTRYFDFAAGQFCVFFPTDVHAPSLAVGTPQPVHKVVLKVQIS